ncbi:hypothetical protein RYZ26_12180 [Terasakiella sp. A23]|uniref:hypothetical protein n=1 Tax=Terasakiella sp. FCG-A23 TaxID=3080561 RepID=UPI0029538D6D|nr:hypothetical protein [Terasakiella sp. A23]MDV7340353.1 hypothetical protein [Terasakiella sp. A23]
MSTLIITGLLFIAAIALGLSIFISLHKFSDAYKSAVDDRFYFAMGETAKNLEAEMQLGQTIDKLTSAQKSIDALKTIDTDVISVEIFDDKGRTIYSTDNSFLFGFIPDTWEQAWKNTATKQWLVRGDEANALGLNLKNSLDQSVGSLVVLYSSQIEKRAFATIKDKLLNAALWISAICAMVLSLVIYLLSQPLKQHLLAFENGIKAEDSTEALTKDFQTARLSAEKQLNDLETELHKIDEGET